MVLYKSSAEKGGMNKIWSSGVVVNMPPCHGGDRGFESHLDRHMKHNRAKLYFFYVQMQVESGVTIHFFFRNYYEYF